MGRGSHDKNYKVVKNHYGKELRSQDENYKFVIDTSISIDDYVPINISKSNSEIQQFDVSSSSEWSKYIKNYLHKYNAKVAYGGYLEERDLYNRSNQFSSEESSKNRNIHLGVDFWCEANTSVLAIVRGRVHSFQNNLGIGNYGPTIILEHYIQGEIFYSLYGHLSLESIENVEIGQFVEDGEKIGEVGDASINGDYAPHLHFQIIEDLQGHSGDYPGVSSLENLAFYKDNCPDPNFILKFLKS